MSVRTSSAPISSAAPAVVAAFWDRFVKDAHVLVAEGFARLTPSSLAKDHEEFISGKIVEAIDDWYVANGRPEWTREYAVTPEVPLRDARRQGKARKRIDIQVEGRSGAGRPPRFLFEAKRFHNSNSVSAYVGQSGLGEFIEGNYAREAPAAGMLGYVQKGTLQEVIDKVDDKLDGERVLHGLAPKGVVWTSTTLDARLGNTRISTHTRRNSLGTIAIYHSFLLCR